MCRDGSTLTPEARRALAELLDLMSIALGGATSIGPVDFGPPAPTAEGAP